jgi:arabinose-5-phosphate isomerase
VADRALARKVLETEAAAIVSLVDRLDARFDAAVDTLRRCKGRVILTGMGKSGIICRKIAATLTSTGTPAFFLHPAEATHGDLGVIQGDDVVLALSYSGETDELLRLLETIRRVGAKLIAITGGPSSTLALAADVALDCSVTEEACPMNLVPTASTTAALAIGDALAMCLLVEKGFREEDFANLHPGGKLGKRLMRVEALMHSGDRCPIVKPDTLMRDVIYEMSSKGLGMTCVVDGDDALLGIITDGDLRRHMERGAAFLEFRAADVMTRDPVSVPPTTLAAQALNIMEQRKITSVVVADGSQAQRVAGVVHLHDLWRMEMF